MSLARAFTARKGKEMSDNFKRNNTLTKSPSQQHLRHKISAPVELVHTTNMLSYNAPDLPRPRNVSDASRSHIAPDVPRAYHGPEVPRSYNPSDTSRWPLRNDSKSSKHDSDSEATPTPSSTPPTSPDGEPDSSCTSQSNNRPSSVQPNHLSSYFMAPGKPIAPEVIPAVPKRSPSHTKKNSVEAVMRKASIRMSEQSFSTKGSTFSRTPSISTRASSVSRASATHFTKLAPPPIPPPAPTLDLPILPVLEEDILPIHTRPAPSKPASHPFGQELAQVTELAEEFAATGRLDVLHEDDQYLMAHGLAKMSPDDYLNEIHNIMTQFFPERHSPVTVSMGRPVAAGWI